MFKCFLDEEKLQLPLSANLFTVYQNGKITDNQGNVVPSYINSNGELVVNICWIQGFREYRVAVLVAHTFKPLRMAYVHWKDVDVLFYDNNHLNVHPSNLIWKFPSSGIESNQYKGYFFIPNFTNYVISKDGEVIQYHTGNKLKGNHHGKGYRYFTLVPDVKPQGRTPSIGRHRLLASVFLDYPANVDDLEVNHKNGIPGTDYIDNLEWLTRKENIKHAFENNLRKDNKPVIVKDSRTGFETRYFSAHECERTLGLGRSVVHWRIKQGNNKIFPPGLSFRYENDSCKPCDEKKFGIQVKLTNLETGDSQIFPSMKQCSEFIGVSKKVIQRRLLSDKKGYYKAYLFEVL